MAEKKPIDSTVMAAIITGIVTIVVTAITVLGPKLIGNKGEPVEKNTPTPVVIVATPTVASPVPATDAPASTPVEANTPLPEPTVAPTEIPLLEAGQDWLQNCISQKWVVYPDPNADASAGCYQAPVANIFATSDQHLTFFYSDRVLSANLIGLFAEIPSASLVDITLHIDEISVGEVWVGVMGDTNVDAKGLVLMAPQGNAKNSAFSIRTMPNFEELFLSSKFKKDNGDYVISFDVSPTTVGATLEKYTPINPVPVASPKKYLFVGIRALPGGTNSISGYFRDLKVTPK